MGEKGKISLDTLVSELYMVGPSYASRLKRLGIETVENLLYHFPHRYNDFSVLSKIGEVKPGEKVTLKGEVFSMVNLRTKRGKRIQKAVIGDETGKIGAVWFNQPFLVRNIKKGDIIFVAGEVDLFWHQKVLTSPEYEVKKKEEGGSIHTGRLAPVYPETYGLTSKWLRSRIYPLLELLKDEIRDFLPGKVKEKYGFMDLYEAISQIHFPDNKRKASLAVERLAFDELFLIQLATLKRKLEGEKEKASKKLAIKKFRKEIDNFEKGLPFKLTKAQKRAVWEIFSDLEKKKAMNRILEGDVGAGKTVVAVIAMYGVFLNGAKSILMCPTEILAKQHFETIKDFLEPFGVKVGLRTLGFKTKTKEIKKKDVIIGTHALLNLKDAFEKVGLVVVDEQHRFGVKQRAKLRKKGLNPHFLAMSATPIPRTIALTLYGDLNLSVIDEMPKGRVKVKTWVVPPSKRKRAYKWIKEKIKEEKAQVFIICPLIEESESMVDVRAVTTEYERLKKEVFREFKVGLLHGKVKSKEKDKIVTDFAKGKIDVLVSTPVVEVGIDIPGATIMMVEGAERFGLATLHQLRGRVGRRDKESYCLLFANSSSQRVLKRLKALEKMEIGMEIAEYDLMLRGPGEIYGIRQHGIPDLRVASFSDLRLIEKTRKEAEEILKDDLRLESFPFLQERLEKYIIKSVFLD